MPWLNISYNDPTVRRQLEGICGKPFGLWSTLCRGGSGSPRLLLADASEDLIAPFNRLEDRRYFSIEVRTGGLLLRCRDHLETLALPLAWDMLRELVLMAPGSARHGVLRMALCDGGLLLVHVPREHWNGVARLLRGAAPEGVFRTRATSL